MIDDPADYSPDAEPSSSLVDPELIAVIDALLSTDEAVQLNDQPLRVSRHNDGVSIRTASTLVTFVAISCDLVAALIASDNPAAGSLRPRPYDEEDSVHVERFDTVSALDVSLIQLSDLERVPDLLVKEHLTRDEALSVLRVSGLLRAVGVAILDLVSHPYLVDYATTICMTASLLETQFLAALSA